MVACEGRFAVAVTPYYLSLMRPDPDCPIRRQALPNESELVTFPFERVDPLAEESHMPVRGLTHRYPDRALLYVSHNCPVYCRHCTRKRKVADPSTASRREDIDAALSYLARTPSIRDVVVSGGDPLTLSDDRLMDVLGRLAAIDHLDVIRIGTRNPVTLPQRITPALASRLSTIRSLYVHTHFNHPAECTLAAARALELLPSSGCVLGNQMVLLRGINDDPQTVLQLNRWLLRHRCRPYYMLQADMAEGITHFRTPLSVGMEIVRSLRGRISGMGIPHFVVDLPGGGGKVALTPDAIVSREGSRIWFRNAEGKVYEFHDVDRSDSPGAC